MTSRLVIATPVDGNQHTGVVHAGYSVALAKLLRDNHGLEALPAHLMFSCDIVRARNRAAWKILCDMPVCTHVLWWDSDVIPRDLSIVGRMLATGEDVIGAPYLRKADPPMFTHMGEPDENGWVRGVGFGFTITSVRCLKMMASICPKYTDFLTDGRMLDDTPDIFDLTYDVHPSGKRMKLSEDFSFCKRWRDLGGKVALYLGEGSILSHVGGKAYTPNQKT